MACILFRLNELSQLFKILNRTSQTVSEKKEMHDKPKAFNRKKINRVRA